MLSASFIPVYSRLLAAGDERSAHRTAAAVAGLLGLATSALVLLGIMFAPQLIAVVAPGFDDGRRDLTIRLVRILFPGAGLLVLSAWCLGVLNSHGRFLLSYAAPVLWNLAIIAALVSYGSRTGQSRLAEIAAWGSVAGSALQFAVQLPTVARLLRGIRPKWLSAGRTPPVRAILGNFGPVFVGRGVVQISAYVDTLLASLLPVGAVAALSYAQVLYTLPVSLFGMSVSAAELPAMSRAGGDAEARAGHLRGRLETGLRQISFFVVPSAVVFVFLGDVVVGALYQSGEFDRPMTLYVWGILAGSAVGLLASTLGRLYASAFYALHDTRTPLNFALVRVGLTVGLGYLFAIPGPRWLGIEPRWGAAGLTVSAGVAGWMEFLLLRRALTHRIGRTGPPGRFAVRLWSAAAAGAGVAWAVRLPLPALHPIPLAVATLGAFGLTYAGAAAGLGIPEARRLTRRLRLRS